MNSATLKIGNEKGFLSNLNWFEFINVLHTVHLFDNRKEQFL